MNQLFVPAIAHHGMEGVYVATAPNPVSNAVFMRALRNAMGQPIGLPAKAWMARLGAKLLLRTDPDLALYGRYCVSRRLEAEGFSFAFPEIESALRDVFRKTHA
jgi:NAD dependent epimerase/dehydratase family enzyme